MIYYEPYNVFVHSLDEEDILRKNEKEIYKNENLVIDTYISDIQQDKYKGDMFCYITFRNEKKSIIPVNLIPKKVKHLIILNSKKLIIPELNDNFKTLILRNNIIKKWPKKFPKNLIELDISECHLKTLPKNIKNLEKLKILEFEKNELTKFPKYLPDNLAYIYGRYNKISKLPDKFPSYLQTLYMMFNLIENFPDFSTYKYLKEVNLYKNKINKIPIIPKNIKINY